MAGQCLWRGPDSEQCQAEPGALQLAQWSSLPLPVGSVAWLILAQAAGLFTGFLFCHTSIACCSHHMIIFPSQQSELSFWRPWCLRDIIITSTSWRYDFLWSWSETVEVVLQPCQEPESSSKLNGICSE